jgi:hypothetical protein
MKAILTKALALSGLCALFAGVGVGANAQGYDHYRYDHDGMSGGGHRPVVHQARQRIHRLQRVYAHSIHNGNTEAARRAHLRAQAIRARLREHRLNSY